MFGGVCVSQKRKSAVREGESSILKGRRRKRSAINEEFKNKRHHKSIKHVREDAQLVLFLLF